MPTALTLDSKIAAIRTHFAPLIGAKLIAYETAELLLLDGTWTVWPDLPIRLHTDAIAMVAISWSRFDDLWLASDSSLPFAIDESTVRWLRNSDARLNCSVGEIIRSAMLGRGEMSFQGRDIEIWTRLVVQVGDGWVEIFNALDENGYAFHPQRPDGEFMPCI